MSGIILFALKTACRIKLLSASLGIGGLSIVWVVSTYSATNTERSLAVALRRVEHGLERQAAVRFRQPLHGV